MPEEALQEREINRTGSGFATLSRKGSSRGGGSSNGRANTNNNTNGHAGANGHAVGAAPPVSRRRNLTSNGSQHIDIELGEAKTNVSSLQQCHLWVYLTY